MITARALLDNGGDVARTAGQLHIHRTTLYYRLDRIEALTGVDLKAGPGRDDLHMALRLAAFRLAAEAPGPTVGAGRRVKPVRLLSKDEAASSGRAPKPRG